MNLNSFDKKLEALKIWYAIFSAIIDSPGSLTAEQQLARFRRLREKILEEAPELALLERKSDGERN